MIGGTDVIIPVSRQTNALGIAVSAVCRLWQEAVIEDAKTGEILNGGDDPSMEGRDEILAFRDAKAAKLWDELGADPSLDGTLIHFLLTPGELTVVIDDAPSREIEGFVEDLRQLFSRASLTKQT